MGPLRSTRQTPKFQSAPPRGGRLWTSGVRVAAATFQSAPPRGGRPVRDDLRLATVAVSIRAPARGATRRDGGERPDRLVSIRAPARGATTEVWRRDGFPMGVSIRAPARGATNCPRPTSQAPRRFNPRPRAGGDQGAGRKNWEHCGFNPRPLAGGDVAWSPVLKQLVEFQSAPPRGGRRRRALALRSRDDVSIRAPARGATPVSVFDCQTTRNSSVCANLYAR